MSTWTGRVRCIVVVTALLTGVGFAWTSRGSSRLGADCVWASGADAAQVERFFRSWLEENHGPTLTGWNVQVEQRSAQIELGTDAGAYRIALVLDPECSRPPDARLLRPERSVGFPTTKNLHALAAGFPAPKLQLNATSRSASVIVELFIIIAFFGLGLAASFPPPNTVSLRSTARDVGWVLLLVGLAAWPVLFAPFDTDTPVLRAAFAATDVFGDWNHPFLPYLLNRPTTWFSLEPWALRFVPFAFLCAETAAMMLAANRDGGNLAGALAGIWFACEVRRRHGLFDLGDWDVAGTFLMMLLLAVQRRERMAWRDVLVVGTLIAGGVMSSWLMIVVSGVLIGCLGIEAVRGRVETRPAIALAVMFALLAVFSLSVFGAGTGQQAIVTVRELWQQMYAETPVSRSLAMALPIVLGVTWLARNSHRLGPRFVALTLIAMPVAIYVAHQRSHVNGGYYVGLVTPMLLYASSVATARAIEALVDRISRVGILGARAPLAIAVRGAIVLAVALATVSRLGTDGRGVGAEHLKTLAHDSRADSLPIFTNFPDLSRLLAFERARAGEGSIADVIASGPEDLRPRLRLIERGGCVPVPPSPTAGFYLAYFDNDDPEARRNCLDRLGSRCRDLSTTPTVGQRTTWVLRCDSSGPLVPY